MSVDFKLHAAVREAGLRWPGPVPGLDTLKSSLLLRRLPDRPMLDLHAHGANSYYTLPEGSAGGSDRRHRTADQGEYVADWGEQALYRGEPGPDWGEWALDWGEFATDRGGFAADRGGFPVSAQAAIAELGKRPRQQRLRAVIELLCGLQDWTTPAELSRWLNVQRGNLSARHLSPMVEAGQLERRYPDKLAHPEQAYRTTARQGLLLPTPDDAS